MTTATDYAIQKVRSFLEIISSVRELDFPYSPPKAAVDFIRKLFDSHLAHLQDVSDEASARRMCRQISEDMDNYLLALGFMVTACDNRGALELQRPLLRITHQAIGSHAQLVISSEWRFSPFTLLYPGEFGNQFVLVGLPVSEAGNPLIAPLAGHELGHNIWYRLDKLRDHFDAQVSARISASIKSDDLWPKFSKAFRLEKQEEIDQDDLFQPLSPWQIAKQWALSHCEEMFCDFIGLAIFGESYLHAFQYLIAPGGGFRSATYPSMRDRVDALVVASKALTLQVPANFSAAFDEADVSSDHQQQLILSASDAASGGLVTELADAAIHFSKKRELINRHPDDVDRIFESFKRVVPATNARSLPNIINAAWKLYLDPTNPWVEDYPITQKKPEKRIELIRELALKSFEVFEIENIQENKDALIVQPDRPAP